MMTNRELFHATMRQENGDKLLHFELGFNIPYDDWLKAGLPHHVRNAGFAEITPELNLFDHFEVSGYAMCHFDQFCFPKFESRILEEKDGCRTEINERGATLQRTIGGHGSPPHEIDFAIKTMADYQANRFRFVGNIDRRHDADWIKNHAPAIFKEIMGPWYRAWKNYLVSMGVPWIMLDTDGNPGGLAKLWYEAGVDCMQPWEVNSSDMLKFAEEFPHYVVMGGIYKHMFEPGDPAQVGRFKSADVHRAIDEELARVVQPMKKRGGYIAALDHLAFWGTTYEGYGYYSRQLREKYGKANRVTRFEHARL